MNSAHSIYMDASISFRRPFSIKVRDIIYNIDDIIKIKQTHEIHETREIIENNISNIIINLYDYYSIKTVYIHVIEYIYASLSIPEEEYASNDPLFKIDINDIIDINSEYKTNTNKTKYEDILSRYIPFDSESYRSSDIRIQNYNIKVDYKNGLLMLLKYNNKYSSSQTITYILDLYREFISQVIEYFYTNFNIVLDEIKSPSNVLKTKSAAISIEHAKN